MKPKNKYLTEVFEPWCYVAQTYGDPIQLPLLVILQNTTCTKGDILIINISIDQAHQTVTLTTNQGIIEINENNRWVIKLGKTKAGLGQYIFAHYLE